jgi:hypothetical protein
MNGRTTIWGCWTKKTRDLVQYSQLFHNLQMSKKARVVHCTSLESLVIGKHSSLWGPFTIYEENEVW